MRVAVLTSLTLEPILQDSTPSTNFIPVFKKQQLFYIHLVSNSKPTYLHHLIKIGVCFLMTELTS